MAGAMEAAEKIHEIISSIVDEAAWLPWSLSAKTERDWRVPAMTVQNGLLHVSNPVGNLSFWFPCLSEVALWKEGLLICRYLPSVRTKLPATPTTLEVPNLDETWLQRICDSNPTLIDPMVQGED